MISLKGFSSFKQNIYLNKITFVWFKQNIIERNRYLLKSNKLFFKTNYCIRIHSRFPITRFPVIRPPFYERVTPPYNEQTIDPSSPTTTEWSALEFQTLYFWQISQFFIPFSKFVKISIFLFIVKTFLFFWKYSKIHLISIDIFIIILLYF